MSTSPGDRVELIRSYLAWGRRQDDADFAAWEEVTMLVLRNPSEGWPLVLELIARADDDASLGFIAAGPLEDFVRAHGARVEEEIVTAVRRDPGMRRAITGVWGWDSVAEPLRTRLLQLLGPVAGAGVESKPRKR